MLPGKNRSQVSFFFSFDNHLHVCMPTLFLVAFFSFLRISNLVPYKLCDISDTQSCFLRLSSIIFTAQGGLLCIPLIPGSPLCPVTTLRQYLSSVKLSPHSPLFVCRPQGTYKLILAHQYNAFL